MLLSQFPQALISSRFVILHVVVPGICEFDELSPLQIFNFMQLNSLPLLHLPHLPLQLNLRYLFELDFGLFRLEVPFLLFQLLSIVLENSQKCHNFVIG